MGRLKDNVFKKCSKGKFKKIGYGSYKSCIKAGGAPLEGTTIKFYMTGLRGKGPSKVGNLFRKCSPKAGKINWKTLGYKSFQKCVKGKAKKI